MKKLNKNHEQTFNQVFLKEVYMKEGCYYFIGWNGKIKRKFYHIHVWRRQTEKGFNLCNFYKRTTLFKNNKYQIKNKKDAFLMAKSSTIIPLTKEDLEEFNIIY